MQFVECPNCGITIEIISLNCCIFRCGMLKNTKLRNLTPEETQILIKENIINDKLELQPISNEVKAELLNEQILTENLEQIPPHLHKEECDRLVSLDLIYGCGKPFRYNKDTQQTEICGYI